MIEIYSVQPAVLARMKPGPVGSYLGSFGVWLEQCGYSKNSIRDKLHAADEFGWWLHKKGLSLADVGEDTVARYVAGFPRIPCAGKPAGRLPQVAIGLSSLVSFLREQGAIPLSSFTLPVTKMERFLSHFEEYLEQVRGLCPSTRSKHMRHVRRFLNQKFGASAPDWRSLEAEDMTRFVRREAPRLSSPRDVTASLRALLRFLITQDAVPPGLIAAIPTIRSWKLATLPQHVLEDDIECTLGVCRDGTLVGTRDLAILTLLARLGLRAGEVARLSLDDIDWAEGRVLIRAGKTHRERSLPVMQEVGGVIAGYLKVARPKSVHRTLFLACVAPFFPLSPFTISSIARCRLKQAGVKAPHLGARTFRHTVATHLVRGGASFKEVADLLGHQHLGTTNIYAKLDLAALSRVPLPWPGGGR